jgi:hypothetical protein
LNGRLCPRSSRQYQAQFLDLNERMSVAYNDLGVALQVRLDPLAGPPDSSATFVLRAPACAPSLAPPGHSLGPLTTIVPPALPCTCPYGGWLGAVFTVHRLPLRGGCRWLEQQARASRAPPPPPCLLPLVCLLTRPPWLERWRRMSARTCARLLPMCCSWAPAPRTVHQREVLAVEAPAVAGRQQVSCWTQLVLGP